jgi:hypothetical protein
LLVHETESSDQDFTSASGTHPQRAVRESAKAVSALLKKIKLQDNSDDEDEDTYLSDAYQEDLMGHHPTLEDAPVDDGSEIEYVDVAYVNRDVANNEEVPTLKVKNVAQVSAQARGGESESEDIDIDGA